MEWHKLKTFTLLILLVSTSVLDGFAVNIISVINGENPIYGYSAMAPVFDVAFSRMRATYPAVYKNASRFQVYTPGSFSCPDAAALVLTVSNRIWRILSEHRGEFSIIFTPGCSLEVVALGDFAREWDIPLFASIAGDQSLGDKNRYPTVATFPVVDHVSTPAAAEILLRRFHWRTVTILCDTLSQYPALSTFYGLSCNNFKMTLDRNLGAYQVTKLSLDSKESRNYEILLRKAGRISRVIVIFTHPRILRDIMISAHRLNMTNGDYIYLSSQPTRVPSFGNLTWQFNDADDQEAFESFRSLIVFNNPNPIWGKISDILSNISTMAATNYNNTLSGDGLLNDLAVSLYEAVEAFSIVANRSQQELEQVDNHRFAKRFWNKSFSLSARDLIIGGNGMRVSDVQFFRLNVETSLMEETWHFDAINHQLKTVSKNLSQQWFNSHGPPPDQPRCGFNNDQCFETSSGSLEAIVASVVCLAGISLFTLLYLKRSLNKDLDSRWWLLSNSLLSDKSSLKLPIRTIIDVIDGSETVDALTDRLFGYRQEPVWVEKVVASYARSDDQLASNHTLQKTLYVIRQLQHENISRFIGLINDKIIMLLFEYGARGNLRSLLSNESVSVDRAMQSSLIWEMIEGLNYLNKSPLQCHGKLSSLSAMVSNRFCLQLGSYAVSKISTITSAKNLTDPEDPAILWMAPEMITNEKSPGCTASDVFSFSVVTTEIITRSTPFSVNLQSKSDILRKINAVQRNSKADRFLGVENAFQENIALNRRDQELHNILKECLDPDPLERPQLKRLMQRLKLHLPRGNLVSSILNRLEKYSEDLEVVVANRTRELLDEAKKVDDLLSEVIPRDFIGKLRNKEPVAAEDFDSVTVLFSDFPQFGSFCLTATPLQVIVLLNNIYVTFDAILPLFDVYKVETINDSYMVASGLPKRNENRHAGQIANMALAMMEAARQSNFTTTREESGRMLLRIGFNSGHCAAGVVGLRMPRYCLFGDTINTASRMESHGEVSKIHVSLSSKILLDDLGGFLTDSRGEIQIKGKGIVETFWLTGHRTQETQ